MTKSILIFVAVWAILGNVQPVFAQPSPQTSQPAIQVGSNDADFAAVSRLAAIDARERELAIDREKADLAAQQSMAKSAGRLLEPSWAQVWIGGLGLLGLIVSLSFTAWSLRQTQRALESQKKTAELEMRAYLGVDEFRMPKVAAKTKLEFSFDIKNYGRTPAVKFTNSMVVKLIPKGGEPSFLPDPTEKVVDVNPGQVFVLSEHLPAMDESQLAEFKGDDPKDGASVSVVISLNYETLGARYEDTFKMLFWGDKLSRSKIICDHT